MPKLLNDLAYAQPENVFTGLPVNEIKALNEQASQDYNQAFEAKNALDVLYENLKVSDKDYQIKKDAITGYKSQIDDLVKKGDYQNAKYLARSLKTKFDTDQLLQGAIGEKKAEDAYYEEQKDKLAKGEIDQKRFNFAVTQTRNANVKPLEYDPETLQFKNVFQGTKVGKDLSDEIEKDTDNFITGFKESKIPFKSVDRYGNVNNFEVRNIDGENKVFINNVGVTEERLNTAIKQHVLNQNKYKDYLEEEVNLDKFGKKYNPKTKQVEPLERKDLKEYTDQELQRSFVGASDDEIARLNSDTKMVGGKKVAKSSQEIQADKYLAHDFEEKKKSFDINDPQQLENIYYNKSMNRKINELALPGTIKGAYEKADYKLFKSEIAIEAFKAKKAKELEEFKHSYDPKMITNFANVDVTGKDVDKIYTVNNDVKKAFSQAQQNLKNAEGTNAYSMRLYEFNKAKNDLAISNANLKDTYNNVSPQGKEELKKRISGFFNQQEGWMSNWEFRPNAQQMNQLKDEAIKQKDNETLSLLRKAEQAFSHKGELAKEDAEKLGERLSKNGDYTKVAVDIDNERIQRSTMFPTDPKERGDFPNVLKIAYGLGAYHTTLSDNAQDIVRNDYQKGDNEKKVRSVVIIPDSGKPTAHGGNTPIQQQYHETARAALGVPSSIMTNTGESLEDATKRAFYGLNIKGKDVQKEIDPSQTQVGLVLGSNGKLEFAIQYKDKNGHDLVDSKGQRPTFFVNAEDNNIPTTLFQIAEDYATQTKDSKMQERLAAERTYGETFADIRLGQDSDPITITAGNGVPISIQEEAVRDKNGNIIKGASYIKGAKSGEYFKDDKQQPKIFKDKEELQIYFKNLK